MQTKQLGKTDLNLTRVGLGTWAIGGGDWKFGWGPQDEKEAVAAVHRAIDLGIKASIPHIIDGTSSAAHDEGSES